MYSNLLPVMPLFHNTKLLLVENYIKMMIVVTKNVIVVILDFEKITSKFHIYLCVVM